MLKLLPYQKQLADVLGVTEEEYAEFLNQQHIYRDVKEGTDLDIKNEWGTVAIILTVIGTLLQVASALLAPKPQSAKQDSSGDAVTKDQVLAPRYGFNGAQQLAKYGDPVPLVYTNGFDNKNGGVRVNISMVFSAVISKGTYQTMTLSGVIGAAPLWNIDFSRVAVGQLPVSSMGRRDLWIYCQELGGPPLLANLRWGQYGYDEQEKGLPSYAPAARIDRFDSDANGFSQCFTPSTNTTCGVVGVIPLAIDLCPLDNSGDRAFVALPIYMNGGRVEYFGVSRPMVPEQALIDFTMSSLNDFDDFATKARNDGLLSAFSVLDPSSTYKLGSALFEVESISSQYISTNDVYFYLRCIGQGKMPQVGYDTRHWLNTTEFDVVKRLFTKAIASVQLIKYNSVTKCNIIDLALRCQAWRRISGRANLYGSDQNNFGDQASDNGIKPRVSMFKVYFGIDGGAKQLIPYIFCVRGTSEQDMFNSLRILDLGGTHNWEIVIEPVLEVWAEGASWGCAGFCYYVGSGDYTRLNTNVPNIFFEWNGFVKYWNNIPYPPLDDSPDETTEWDLFHTDAITQYQLSFERGPEVTLTSVTEQLWGTNLSAGYYTNLTMLTVRARSGAGLQDLRSISAWVYQGKPVRYLDFSPSVYLNNLNCLSFGLKNVDGPSCSAPEIFADTVLDKENGIGAYARVENIELFELAKANRFTKANNLFMDGVIADTRPWREFWAQVGAFSLLELAKIGGRETLIPAVPYDSNYFFTRSINISGIFNQGNILPDSYKEDYLDFGPSTQDVIATVIYRDTESRAFPRNNTVTVQLKDVVELGATRETIDASQYVTNRFQAKLLGQYICNVRRHVRRAIEFKTLPTDTPIFPGAYVYVDIGRNEWQQIYSGVVGSDGKLNAPVAEATSAVGIPNGSYNALLYKSGSNPINIIATVSSGTAAGLASYAGYLFVLGNAVRVKRVFRITDVEMDEDAEVTIKATYYPCDDNGGNLLSRVANFDDLLFLIR